MTDDVDLREHIEAIFREHQRAIQIADTEREKAAVALREGLAREIREGDERLREHIQNQVSQIREAFDSSEKLEVARIDEVKQLAHGIQREIAASFQAAQLAVQKAEENQRAVNLSQNEFRSTLRDQAAELMPRKETESAFKEIRDQLSDLRSRLDVGPASLPLLQSRLDTEGGRQQGVHFSTSMLFGGLAALAAVISIVVVLSSVLTRPPSQAPTVTVTTRGTP